MWYIAFTLGLFGSMHCIGMCGPLAIAFTNREHNSKFSEVFTALSYNLGRTITYSILGLLFGLFGNLMVVNNFQSAFSIILGLLLITSFVFAIDIENKINTSTLFGSYYSKVRQLLSDMINKTKSYPTFVLGMANGLLPCGLVYLAVAGSLASGTMIGGALFMMFFGLGTIPAMLALIIGSNTIPFNWRKNFRKVLPYITLLFGCFLIYRGITVDLPLNMDFWSQYVGGNICK